MHPLIVKTFGGLTPAYYFRQLFFGLAFPALVYMALSRSSQPFQWSTVLLVIVNTLLYPYSRFVYESVIDFIVGNNVFFGNAVLMIAFKIVMMTFCWVLAIFIAPIGLVYLYFHHSRGLR